MIFALYTRIRHVLTGTGILLLVVLLVACGGGKAINPSSATATARALLPTPTPTFAAYNGSGFTIKYPPTWKSTSSNNEEAFSDETGGYNMTIGFTPNPNGATSPDQLADAGLTGAKTNLKNPQIINLPSTTILSGQTWSQRAVSGTSTVSGENGDVEAVVLATNYPKFASNTKAYILVYVAPKKDFEQAKNKYFTPMLQSFAFTS